MKIKHEFKYDIRIVERLIDEGELSKRDYQDYLKKLNDVTDKGCPLIIEGLTEEIQGEEETIEESLREENQ